MRTLILFGLALIASASAYVEVGKGYHAAVGIPLAEKIKAEEEKILADVSTASAADVQDRIVGGVLAPINAHPYFAGILIDFVNIAGNSVCGSSLLTANRLVTAAHCWFDGVNQAWRFTVILGTNFLFSGGTRIATTTVIMHPQYFHGFLTNDVAMIYLPQSVTFSASIHPIDLPNTSELWETFQGMWTTAAGFGRTSDAQVGASTVVSQVSLQVINLSQCMLIYGSHYVTASSLCTNGAGGIGICGGDSGGPLVTFYNGRNVLVGISSFVARDGCQLGHPSAFARVTSFYSFITQHL